MNKFEKLGLSPEVISVLSKMDITEPTEIQEKAIPLAMAGEDIIGGSATGSGKTLAFAAPIMEKMFPNDFVQALILTPTRELADQVATSVRKFSKNKGLEVLAVYGGVDIQRQIRKIGQTDILVGTPGRVLDHLNRKTLRLDHVNFLVLDEVDRMFDMGFQRDVERILDQCQKDRQTMLFSATISADINHLAQKHTRNAKEVAVQSNVDPKKLKQVYYDVETNQKFSLLAHLLRQEKSNLVMVFCSTRRNTDFVAKHLWDSGVKAKAIHGGLIQSKRTRIIKDFQDNIVNVLVCTDVAARGLDIKGVSHVYNYDLPKESNDYIHRIGRTARAGEEGIAINIVSNRDYDNFSRIIAREDVNIIPIELPKFDRVMIRMDSSRDSRDNRGPRRDSGRSGYGSRDGGSSRGPRRDSRGPRQDSRGPRRDSGRSEGRSDSRPRSGGRDGGSQSRFGNKDGGSSRGPRRDSRPSSRSGGSRDSRPRSGSRDGGSRSRGSGGRDSSSRGPRRDSRPSSRSGGRNDSRPRSGNRNRR